MINFDPVARPYDALAELVYWGAIQQSRKYFVEEINANSTILVVGGGTGEILEELPSGLFVDYVEPSAAMIRKASGRRHKLAHINFIQCELSKIKSGQQYDWIICNYVLDLFEKDELRLHLLLIKDLMSSASRLIVTDFQIQQGKIWQFILSTAMHLFFRLTTGLLKSKLLDLNSSLIENGFSRIRNQTFYGAFIFSAIYCKKV